jgi:polyphosphate kinase
MVIRGIFCAENNQNGAPKPMTAISIVDEYLEHSRIWLFHNDGNEKIYIGSADWMARNLDHRVEVAIPIWDEGIKEELKHILKIKLNDNVKARVLDKGLTNQYVSSKGKKKVRSQLAVYNYLKRKQTVASRQ